MNKNMYKILSIVLLVLGIGLIYWGYQESGSVGSAINEAFTGSETDRVMIFYIGGAISLAVGLYLFIKK